MKKKVKLLFLITLVATVLLSTSCSKDIDLEEINENEVITKVILHFKEQGTSKELTYSWSDPDGVGGNPPIIEIVLQQGKIYDVSISFLDEVNGEDVTEEITEEAVEHRLYYVPSSASNIQITGLGVDANNVTVGLNSTWTSGSISTGTVKIVLRHYPEGGKLEADLINDSKSSTDVDIQFATKIE